MPTSPISPSRRRRNPSLDLSSTSPGTFATNGYGQVPLRSPRSPTTPQQRNRISRSSADFTPHPDDGGGGLGNLADELANAWDEEGEVEEEVDVSGFQEGNDTQLSEQIGAEEEGNNGSPGSTYSRRRGSQDGLGSGNGSLHPPKQKPKTAHRRQESKYDGSDYGNDSDFEEPGDISPGLEARISGIESLVRWGTGDNTAPSDELVSRVIDGLRDLGGQSGIENGASRLITAHASLTSHLTHQTRTLQTLTHPLLFSPFPTLSANDIDDLIPLIDNVLPNLPFPISQTHLDPQPEAPPSDPLASLQNLLSQTSELTHVLRALGDTIHESRQLTSTASRRLKSVRELVADMRREEEEREEGTRWIEKGEWDRRLEEREAGRVCGDVVSGFEAVCGEWRARLFGAEVAAA